MEAMAVSTTLACFALMRVRSSIFEAEDVTVLDSGCASMEIRSSLAPLVNALFTALVPTSNAITDAAFPFVADSVICC